MSTKRAVEDWELLAQVAQSYRTLSDALMEQIAMHRAQAILLCQLYLEDGQTQSEIAEELAVQGATVANMLQRMEEAGLVNRRRDVDDNRLVRVYLTACGREKERSIVAQFLKLEATIFEGFSADERELLRRLLRRLWINMSKET
jgi:MarR family transcriptional regulator, organic hydroperoxide resistance regulator